MDRIKELVEILNKASYEYYINSNEIMSDFEYDKLYDELLELEKSSSTVLANSPTQNVGFTVVDDLKKVTHKFPMLSLDKTKDISKLQSFLDKNEGLISWKMDGLTIVLTYENGRLKEAITRGNGTIGEDITHNAMVFSNIPLSIKYKGLLIVRGEAVITFKSFEKINENLPIDQKYKNPRNLCSGTVRQLNSKIVKDRDVEFFAFSLVNYQDFDFGDKKENSYNLLLESGFKVVEFKKTSGNTVEKDVEYFFGKIASMPFGTDGLVVTYNSYEYSEKLGQTSKFPKDSIAFKWADEEAKTTLIDVFWNTSRTGAINPVGIFEPVELEGTTVNRASLHNISIIENLKLGIGDEIFVYKANMIIPQISRNLTMSDSLKIPNICPACGEKAEILKSKDVKVLYCTNTSCIAKKIEALVHFVSRNAMNIEGLSISTIEKFVELGFIKNFVDIFNLKKYKDEIITMEGFGEKSYENLIKAIEKSKNVKVENFLYALGINQVGLSNAKLIVNQIISDGNLNKILDLDIETLIVIDGFGEIIGTNIIEYFSNKDNVDIFNQLTNILNFEKIHKIQTKLDKISVVITGSLEKFENRNALQELIEQNGGKVTSSVSKNTTFLINNDKESTSSKNKKANELNIEIVSENEFCEKFDLF